VFVGKAISSDERRQKNPGKQCARKILERNRLSEREIVRRRVLGGAMNAAGESQSIVCGAVLGKSVEQTKRRIYRCVIGGVMARPNGTVFFLGLFSALCVSRSRNDALKRSQDTDTVQAEYFCHLQSALN